MIMDDYSDNLNDNFEEEYLDEEHNHAASPNKAKAAPKNDIKNDFWEQPKVQPKATLTNNQNISTKAPL